MSHSRTFSVLGGIAALGAPLGLIVVRLIQHHPSSVRLRTGLQELSRDPVAYGYLAVSTSLAFGTMGLMLGRVADRLQDLSDRDPLTGLHNARHLRAQLRVEVARSRRYHAPLSLLLIDIDGLKTVNDAFGHRAGDVALLHVGRCIAEQLRTSDVGARWGGDEFAVLAPHTSSEHALRFADRLRRRVAGEAPRSFRYTVSIGVATSRFVQDADDPEELFARADAALYRAKRRGGDDVCATYGPPDRSCQGVRQPDTISEQTR